MIPSKIVLGFPYEGGFYFLLNQHIDWVATATSRPSGYYPVLFGRDGELMRSKATALAALFEEIIIVGADSSFPDRATHTASDGTYYHRDLRLRVPNAQFAEWQDETVALATELLSKMVIRDVFRTQFSHLVDEHDRLQFLCRLLLQMRAAQEHDAIVVGDDRLCILHDTVLRNLDDTAGVGNAHQFASSSFALTSNTLSLVGLDFGCGDLDTFADIRQSADIRDYATQFRAAISAATTGTDLTGRLLSLMREASGKHHVARRVAGGFETTTSITSLIGLIPGVGTVTGTLGLATDFFGRLVRRDQASREWYLLGPKMHQLALESVLSRHKNR